MWSLKPMDIDRQQLLSVHFMRIWWPNGYSKALVRTCNLMAEGLPAGWTKMTWWSEHAVSWLKAYWLGPKMLRRWENIYRPRNKMLMKWELLHISSLRMDQGTSKDFDETSNLHHWYRYFITYRFYEDLFNFTCRRPTLYLEWYNVIFCPSVKALNALINKHKPTL